MMQVWYELLFAHWPVSRETLRSLIPTPLEIDVFQGQAWLAVTPFHMDLRFRWMPLPTPHFPELNCRTYVTFEGKPGVFFFSLDAASRLAVRGARAAYKLPYSYSRMRVETQQERVIYSAERPESNARFAATYGPDSEVRRSQLGTLENWLTERYCLYTHSRGRLYRGEIHHVPWPLQDGAWEIRENGIAAAAGIELPDTAPLLHFSRRLEVLIWPLRRTN